MTYQPTIPQAGDYLASSQSDILANFTLANTYFSTDHVAFSAGLNQGKHNRSTIVTGGVTATGLGEGQIYVANPSGTRQYAYFRRESSLVDIPFSLIGGFACVSGAGALLGTAFNITSARTAEGRFTLTFTRAMADANYTIVATGDSVATSIRIMTVITKTAANVTLECKGVDNLYHDPDTFSVIVMGIIS